MPGVVVVCTGSVYDNGSCNSGQSVDAGAVRGVGRGHAVYTDLAADRLQEPGISQEPQRTAALLRSNR